MRIALRRLVPKWRSEHTSRISTERCVFVCVCGYQHADLVGAQAGDGERVVCETSLRNFVNATAYAHHFQQKHAMCGCGCDVLVIRS